MRQLPIWLATVALGLASSACIDAQTEATPGSLDQLEITDPNFDFSTSRSVRLELRADEAATPQAIEVTDSEGRRLMDGAFKGSAVVDLKVALGQEDTLKLRVGRGAEATERTLEVDANLRAATDL